MLNWWEMAKPISALTTEQCNQSHVFSPVFTMLARARTPAHPPTYQNNAKHLSPFNCVFVSFALCVIFIVQTISNSLDLLQKGHVDELTIAKEYFQNRPISAMSQRVHILFIQPLTPCKSFPPFCTREHDTSHHHHQMHFSLLIDRKLDCIWWIQVKFDVFAMHIIKMIIMENYWLHFPNNIVHWVHGFFCHGWIFFKFYDLLFYWCDDNYVSFVIMDYGSMNNRCRLDIHRCLSFYTWIFFCWFNDLFTFYLNRICTRSHSLCVSLRSCSCLRSATAFVHPFWHKRDCNASNSFALNDMDRCIHGIVFDSFSIIFFPSTQLLFQWYFRLELHRDREKFETFVERVRENKLNFFLFF